MTVPDSTSPRGLTPDAVLASRSKFGSNVLTPPPRTPWWKEYLSKFNDPVIRILMIAASVAILVGALDGHIAEGVGILVAIFLATFLAFWNEQRAGREFDILNTTSDDVPVKVLRDGGYSQVPKRDVVVDDLVFLEVGEEVPADGTLIEAVGLSVNESKLTGEAIPANKTPTDTLFRGTTIVDGYGLLNVTAVGDSTEIGRTLRESIAENTDESPLNKQLAKLSKIIGVVGFGIAFTAFFALLFRGVLVGTLLFHPGEWLFGSFLFLGLSIATMKIWLPVIADACELTGREFKLPTWFDADGGRPWFITVFAGIVFFCMLVSVGILLHAIPVAPVEWIDRADAKQLLRNFMIAVTIIVVAVPEGLAMSVTLSLAYSMRKMTATNTLVRRMPACETIGAATVICSDKTGTLTLNEMRVAEVRFSEVKTTPTMHAAMAVNSTAHLSRDDGTVTSVGNPTEGALLLWLESQGVDYLKLRNAFAVTTQWTFNTERKFMATLGEVLHVKGAPEIVLARCTHIATENGTAVLGNADRDAIHIQMREYQSRGMRTLAFAIRSESLHETDIDTLAVNLTWLGLVAIADPVRVEVPGALAACRRAGVAVKIVTGDSTETAKEIARQCQFESDPVTLTGPEFAAMNDHDAAAIAPRLAILARARPADKLRLVRLLKAQGEVVAVTGDGVNDGPALNFADVGLAMGKTGTAVAREASDIILLDDSFPSIVAAVRWGRSLYENIQRFILFQLTINVAALGIAVLGPFLGFELPLTVMQMLWVNLIMDTFAALALATEPPHESVLSRPPRSPAAFIVTPPMARFIFGVGGAFLCVLVGLILYFKSGSEDMHDNIPTRGGTILFTTFVLLQFWNLFNAKAMNRAGSVLPTLGNNPMFLVIAAAILAGQFVITQYGGSVFRTVPLGISDWLWMLGLTSAVLWIGEAWRALK